MINFTSEGKKPKIGFNVYRPRGGFVAKWVWYNFETSIATSYYFRLRLYMKPHIIFTKDLFNLKLSAGKEALWEAIWICQKYSKSKRQMYINSQQAEHDQKILGEGMGAMDCAELIKKLAAKYEEKEWMEANKKRKHKQ